LASIQLRWPLEVAVGSCDCTGPPRPTEARSVPQSADYCDLPYP